MAKYLLDTGILAGFIRGSEYAKYAEGKYQLFDPRNEIFISVVSVGEILSLAIQFDWGDAKKAILKKTINEIPWVDINNEEVLNCYAEIDAFCLNKNKAKPLPPGISAKKLQKNDLWIASTASVLNATLLTIDKDFDLLQNEYLNVVYIDKSQKIEN
ncbi:MAG TPA: type II toxin-antitoxin system VapC family toxin [Patescibacteria group bacterium]|nr:type II toxin-antitoxin system VapC family toxin [Patescibacteria group bacterium]